MPRHRHAIEVEKIDGGWRVHAPKVPGCIGVGTTPVTALRSFAAELAIGTHRGATTDMLGVVDELVSGDALSRVLELEEQSQPSPRTPRRSAAPVAERVLQLKVTLRRCRPPIWRRVLVPGGMTLDRLHRVLQAAMGWTDSHLHAFEARDTIYQIPNRDFPPLRPVVDERTVAVGSILRKAKDKLRYDYDFGDGWEHDVVLEKVLPATTEQRVPAVTDGRRACPPEDVGGPWGYGHLLAVLKDPSHEEHDERSEWMGREFDSEELDVEEMDACVAELAKPKPPHEKPRRGVRRRRS